MPDYKNKRDDVYDFGFSFEEPVDKSILETVTNEKERQASNASLWEWRCRRLRAKIEILLKNLEKNPEKEIIRWPNRTEAIATFRLDLNTIEQTDLEDDLDTK